MRLNRLYITVIGNDQDYAIIKDILDGFDYEVILQHQDGSCFEFPSLQKMKELAEEEDFYAVYFHTKGASYSKKNNSGNFEWKRVHTSRWRMLMNYYILYKWNIAVNAMIKGYDAYGILLREVPWPYFSGNFWWAKSSIIKTAVVIDEQYKMNRYNAESWLLNQPNIRVYSPFKRGLLLKISIDKNNNYKLLPWWHWRNLLFVILGMILAK